MAYFIRPVDRELLPEGHSWMFVREHGGGDVHFIIAADAGAVTLPNAALTTIIQDVCAHERIPLSLVV